MLRINIICRTTAKAVIEMLTLLTVLIALINNIAWFLRKFPVFGVFGDGNYRLQPIYVDDLAKLAIDHGRKTENNIIDAIGPETFTYRDLAKEIGRSIGKEKPIISVSPKIGYLIGSVIGKIMRDTVITREEIDGLMLDLLYVDSPPAGWTKLSTWLRANSSSVGIKYSGELHRRKNRIESYDEIWKIRRFDNLKIASNCHYTQSEIEVKIEQSEQNPFGDNETIITDINLFKSEYMSLWKNNQQVYWSEIK